MPTLNLDLDFFDHPKTKRLVGLLGRASEVLPIKLWIYCGKFHAEDGRLADYSAQEIESIVGWWGKPGEMVQAMIRTGLLHQIENGFQVHEWQDHQGHIVTYKKRAGQAAKARWERVRKIGNLDDASSNASSNACCEAKQCQCSAVQINTHPPNPPPGGDEGDGTVSTGELLRQTPAGDDAQTAGAGKVTEEAEGPSARKRRNGVAASGDAESVPIPEGLADSAEFVAVWKEWVQHRREIRHKLTPTTAKRQLRDLAAMGSQRAISTLQHSISKGYIGPYEPVAARGANGFQGNKERDFVEIIKRARGEA